MYKSFAQGAVILAVALLLVAACFSFFHSAGTYEMQLGEAPDSLEVVPDSTLTPLPVDSLHPVPVDSLQELEEGTVNGES